MEEFSYRVDIQAKKEDIRLFLLNCKILTNLDLQIVDGLMEADNFIRPSCSKIFISTADNIFIYDREIAINGDHAMFTVHLNTDDHLVILEDILHSYNLNFEVKKVRML